jgi:hypothetical protein
MIFGLAVRAQISCTDRFHHRRIYECLHFRIILQGTDSDMMSSLPCISLQVPAFPALP